MLDVAASKHNESMFEKLVNGLILNLKKYPDNEIIQINGKN